jgi:hypothetical protein
MDPWYKIVTPRKEVREGRSFNPDEFAFALRRGAELLIPRGSGASLAAKRLTSTISIVSCDTLRW